MPGVLPFARRMTLVEKGGHLLEEKRANVNLDPTKGLRRTLCRTDSAKLAAAIHALKQAAAGDTGRILGKAVKGVGALVRGAGEFGAGVAEGAGVDPALGRLVGITGAGALGVSTTGKAKRKIDEWRYTHGLY